MQKITLTGTDGLEIITAESQPKYDSSFWKNDGWGCEAWLEWHKRLSEVHGTARANEIFLPAWRKISSFDYNKNFCGYSPRFTAYFKEAGIGDIVSFIGHAASGILNIFEDTIDSAENVSENAKRLTKINLKPILIGAGILVLVGGGIYLSRNKKIIASLTNKFNGKEK